MTQRVRNVVLEAVEKLKTCPYKVTGIKLELEAQLDRDFSTDEFLTSWLEELGVDAGEPEYCDNDGYYVLNPSDEIVYAKCYNDGSVDTEITATITLKDPNNIFLLEKMIQAFKVVAKRAGDIFDVDGAGMHIALLNNRDCTYPARTSTSNVTRFANFAESMALLLPALYFLATPNYRSRGLEFRIPSIRRTTSEHGVGKFNAITYKGGALEFRVFDTCYERPEAVLDDVVVIANSMQFWTDTFVNPGLTAITHEVMFGKLHGNELKRFFTTIEHIQLLKAGLKILKPSYYTVAQLKEQRRFELTEEAVVHMDKEFQEQAEEEYAQYEENYAHTFQYRQRFGIGGGAPKEERRGYVANRVNALRRQLRGDFNISCYRDLST